MNTTEDSRLVDGGANNGAQPSVFGIESKDITEFVLLLIPFTLAWSIGYFGFSSFWAFIICACVYWTRFNHLEYSRRHSRLQELIGMTGKVDENSTPIERQATYKKLKAEKIPNRQIPSHLLHNDHQRAEWLNMIITQMWPFISDFIKRILRETVEPSIKTLLPQLNIQFTELSMGDAAPRISSVKVYEPKDGDARDRIELDCQIAWVSSAHIKLKILASTADIEKLQFFGKMRITLEPLLSEPPLLGGMSFTFLFHPDIEYQLSGLAAVANAPGIKAAVQRAVNDAIATYLVMPNRIDVPIATLETNMLHFRLPEGVVRVAVVQASNLHNMDSRFLLQGKSDPYARVKVGSQEETTVTIDSDLNPIWANTKDSASQFIFDFPVHDVVNQQINVELWDKDNDADDFLGETKIFVSEVYNAYHRYKEVEDKPAEEKTTDEEKGYIDKWFPLKGKEIKKGEVRLVINWLAFKSDNGESENIPTKAYPDENINRYFLGVFINSVNCLPDYVRGRQVAVEVELRDAKNFGRKNNKSQIQTTHPAVAPDCSFAETKWFFLNNTDNIFFHYNVNQITQDKTIANLTLSPDEIKDLLSSDVCGSSWSFSIDQALQDKAEGKTHLKSTVALRRLDGHPSAFQIPAVDMNHLKHAEKVNRSNFGSVSSELNTMSSTGTLANPEDFKDRPVLTTVNLTWRYSRNSEIFTIIVHNVGKDFPIGAKLKFRNGKKHIDTRHFNKNDFEDIEDKLELKKIYSDCESQIDVLVRLKAKTLGIGGIDLLGEETQEIKIHTSKNF